jgi:ECF transporter S component (folate family)
MSSLAEIRAITWLAVLIGFVILLALANQFTDGERFYGVAPIATIVLALLGLLGLQRATVDSEAWEIGTREIVVMTLGAALYVLLSYLFNTFLDLSVGQVELRPIVCVPVLFGYAFGPVVGFRTGAVGNLLGDFVTGWGVFPAWAIGSGLTGLIPGWVTILAEEKRNLPFLTMLVVLLVGIAASIVFVHPRVPEPWTGEVHDYSFWGWALIVGGAVLLANRLLLERASVALAAVNLWGTLGIIAGNGFASLAHTWMSEYTLGTALIGEFAPAAASDILNLMILTPLVLASYNAIRERIRRPRGNDG